jgi:thiamine pyrophosphokinase
LQEAFFVRSECKVHGSRGDLISLIPWGGEVRGVTTNGLRWPLSGEMLWSHQTRGISNELLDETASIRLESGVLLVVHYRILNDKAVI